MKQKVSTLTLSQMPLNAKKPDPVIPDPSKLKITTRDVNPLSAVAGLSAATGLAFPDPTFKALCVNTA